MNEKLLRLMAGEIVKKQHVFPKRSLDRFCDASGAIEVHWIEKGDSFSTNSKNGVFCASKEKTWDQKAEILTGVRIEDAFQDVVDRAMAADAYQLNDDDCRKVSEFYALWFYRSEAAGLIFEGSHQLLTPSVVCEEKKQELEKCGVYFVDETGSVAARSQRGIFIDGGILSFLDRHAGMKWFLSRSEEVELLISDNPAGKLFIPISPDRCLVAGESQPVLSADQCRYANSTLMSGAKKFYCARDLNRCV